MSTPPNILVLNPFHSPHLIEWFDQIIKEDVKHSLLAAWDKFTKLDVCFLKEDSYQSKTPALHLGVWELYSSRPHITRDSKKQKDNVIKGHGPISVLCSQFHHFQDIQYFSNLLSCTIRLSNIVSCNFNFLLAMFNIVTRAFNHIMTTLADFANPSALLFDFFLHYPQPWVWIFGECLMSDQDS